MIEAIGLKCPLRESVGDKNKLLGSPRLRVKHGVGWGEDPFVGLSETLGGRPWDSEGDI